MANFLNEYIRHIENHDTSLTRINLNGAGLNDADANRLMEALRKAPEIAKNITDIYLDNNRLTSINIPDELMALIRLRLYDNQLTSINIPDKLTALKELNLGHNQLNSINIPDKLTALEWLDLYSNKLTSINISDKLIALTSLSLYNNQLTSINIPDKLIVLENLHLNNNRLTSITIPDKLIAIRYLQLDNNQLTSINIPDKLIDMRHLHLNNNRLTSINIPDKLIALRILHLNNNRLTAATKLALSELATNSALTINIERNTPVPLTPEILENHFQTIVSTYLSISSVTFKNKVLDLYACTYKNLSLNIVSSYISGFITRSNTQELLLENIAMLRRCFANNAMATETLNSWLESPKMEDIIRMINQKKITEITELLEMYDRKVLDMRKMPHKRAMVASSVAALTWRHKPSYGLNDNTPIEPEQNPFQLAIKQKI